MRVQPIVEGFGEVEALPALLRRLRDESGVFGLELNRPIRQTRSQLVQEPFLRRAVKLALVQGCSGIIILFDGDGDCPKELALKISHWSRLEAPHVSCEVVIANREYEAWFLASLESLRGIRGISGEASHQHSPESVRGAKEALRVAMPGYSPRADQAALTAVFDLAAAHRRCRSFRRLVRAFCNLASDAGIDLPDWPPAAWGAAGPVEP